jgi:hypothetical protein
MHVIAAQLNATKRCELNDPSSRMHAVFVDPPVRRTGYSTCPTRPDWGLTMVETELAHRQVTLEA